MGEVNMPAVVLGALAFFLIGFVWYSLLFGKVWQREAGIGSTAASGSRMVVTFGLCFLFQLLIALMLGHTFARTGPSPRAMMMIATGFGAAIMTPAVGIQYLFQRKSGTLFAIDAGYMIVGMAAMGAVFVLLD